MTSPVTGALVGLGCYWNHGSGIPMEGHVDFDFGPGTEGVYIDLPLLDPRRAIRAVKFSDAECHWGMINITIEKIQKLRLMYLGEHVPVSSIPEFIEGGRYFILLNPDREMHINASFIDISKFSPVITLEGQIRRASLDVLDLPSEFESIPDSLFCLMHTLFKERWRDLLFITTNLCFMEAKDNNIILPGKRSVKDTCSYMDKALADIVNRISIEKFKRIIEIIKVIASAPDSEKVLTIEQLYKESIEAFGVANIKLIMYVYLSYLSFFEPPPIMLRTIMAKHANAFSIAVFNQAGAIS